MPGDRTSRTLLLTLRAGAAVLAALPCVSALGCAGSRAGEGDAPDRDLRVRRGEFVETFVITGELDALRSSDLSVPRVPSSDTSIRWLVDDGAVVAEGDRLVEFDNASFTQNLEEKRLASAQAESELLKREAEIEAGAAERAMQVEVRRIALEKSRKDAEVPKELLPLREWQERQLALRRAEMEHEKALEDRAAQEAADQEEMLQKRIALETTLREIRVAEEAIRALTLRAPTNGIAVIADHPWEGRKLQVGDSLWVGLTVVRIPDLSEMEVVAELSDVDDGRVAPGMPARSFLDAYPERLFAGRVLDVARVAQESEFRSLRRSFRVRVSLDTSDPDRMRPGMSARVEIEARRLADVLVAPRAALDLSGEAAVARTDDGAVEVRLGPCNPQECVVEGGLAEGTRLRRPS